MKKRALISVFDKTGIVEFAKELISLDWEIISTGGTFKTLAAEGIPVIEIQEITQCNEILDGRVKTLHPNIHAGILFRRDKSEHCDTMRDLEISSIDMVVNNLYPFEKTLHTAGATHADLIENIDIGGPSMIRAAAKNYQDVMIVTDAADYAEVITRLKNNTVDAAFTMSLAGKAFNYTAAYDALIAGYFNSKLEIASPEKLTLTYNKIADLRYGENPHQKAAYYKNTYTGENGFEQLHGKQLSYNNLTDMYASIKMVKEFAKPAAVCVKHANPTGIAVAETIDTAFDNAYNCDTVSIFGGIIALNRTVTKHIAEVLNSFFVEIVIAPDFDQEALAILTQKKNIRIIKIANLADCALPGYSAKEVFNGIVYQSYDSELLSAEPKAVTKVQPTAEQMDELLSAFKMAKCVASNGVVIAKNGATVGIGQGEVRRSWAVEEALQRAGEKTEGAVLASDGFFFEDTVELLHEHNIKAVIQPGGSVKDQNVIDLCDTYGIAMVFTGTRHFRH